MPYLDYKASSSTTISDHCKLSVVGKGFESTNIGMAFSPDVLDSEINQFSNALVELQEKGGAPSKGTSDASQYAE